MTDRTDSKEREAFEDWASRGIGRVWRDTTPGRTDCYQDASTNIGWRAWQARASIAPSGFDAADMATASAQGFRDGVASLAANAGSEPVAPDGWLHANGLLYRLTDERHPCNRDEINVTMADGSRSIESRSRRALELLDRIRATHPSPPEGMVGGWMPIETAPEGQMVVVGWLDPEDAEHPERHDFDLLEDGCWRQWHERAEHVEVIGGHGVSYTPPYTVWMPVSPIPTSSADSSKEQP